MDEMLNKKVAVDLDSDGKSDLKIDVKFLGLLIGGIISLTTAYSTLQADIEIAKTLPEQIQQDDTKVINQKIDFLIKEMERFEDDTKRRIESLEDKVYKK